MSKFTARQVEEAIDNHEELSWSEIAWEDYDDEVKLSIDGEDVGFEIVMSDPGGEGHGENVSLVIKVGDQLFHKSGYYASHHGTDWDGVVSEVEAYEKVTVAYRTIKSS